jgi:hypothetical protein
MVLRELELILESSHFRGAKRCQQFLRYSVERALAGDLDQLKERSIGVAVFGRTATYDTGDDAIVRVAAKGVRNRLLQYYSGLTMSPPLRLELPPGSYLPEFQWADAEATPAPPPAPAQKSGGFAHGRKLALAGVGLAAAVAAGLLLWKGRSADALEKFWGPALESPRPILICLASPTVYRLDDAVYRRFGAVDPPGLKPAPVPDAGVVHGRDLIPSTEFVGTGDALAATRLTAVLTRMGKPLQVRSNVEVSFSDLRTAPAVLIGGFSNTWTMEMTRDWRFVLDIPAGWLIRDRSDPSRTWENLAHRQPLRGRTHTSDYGLITRVLDPASGQPLIVVAGLSMYGTTAAAEFLADNSVLSTAFRDAPAGWERKNVQIIIKTTVKGSTAGLPQFVARHLW